MSEAVSSLPPVSAVPPSSAGPGRSLDLGRCFNEALDLYKANFWTLLVAGVLFEVLSACTLLVLTGPLWGGACAMCLALVRGEDQRADLGKLFAGFGRFFPLLGMFLLVVLLTLAGLAALVLPGLVLMTLWMYPAFVMMDKGVGVVESLRMSKDVVVRRGFWPNALLMLVTLVLTLVPAFVPVVGLLVGWLVMPLVLLMPASAYVQLFDEAGRGDAAGAGMVSRCGRCGYIMRGVSTFACPECGADLREVGMIPSRDRD